MEPAATRPNRMLWRAWLIENAREPCHREQLARAIEIMRAIAFSFWAVRPLPSDRLMCLAAGPDVPDQHQERAAPNGDGR
jgi:hypothetical protein